MNALRPVGTNLKVRGREKKLALTKYFLKPKGEFSIFDGKVVVFFFKIFALKVGEGGGFTGLLGPAYSYGPALIDCTTLSTLGPGTT